MPRISVFFGVEVLSKKGHGLNQRFVDDSLHEFSVLLALGPVYAIRWARRKYPTLVRPAVPWGISISVAILLAGILSGIYDFLLLMGYMIFHKQQIIFPSFMKTFLQFVRVDSILKVPVASFFRHILTSFAITGTILLGFYGKLKETAALLLEPFVEKV